MGTVNMMLERAELECLACDLVQRLELQAEQDLIGSTESLALLGDANKLLAASIRLAMRQRHHQFNFHDMPGKWRGNAMLSAADGQQTDVDTMGEKIESWDYSATSTAGVGELSRLTRDYLLAEHIAIDSYHQLLRQRLNMAYRHPLQ